MMRRIASVPSLLLGLFIVWQVIFLPVANLLNLLQRAQRQAEKEPWAQYLAPQWARGQGWVYHVLAAATRITDAWAKVSGQPQNWCLFAPSVATEIDFVAVELRWDDDREPLARSVIPLTANSSIAASLMAMVASDKAPPVMQTPVCLLSINEPPDPNHFLRIGQFRIRRYEGNFDVTSSETPDLASVQASDAWRAAVERLIRDEWPAMRAYMRWRVATFQQLHPELSAPRQIILHLRRYRIPSPAAWPWLWHPPEQYPLARWRPGILGSSEYLPVEMWHPIAERFESLRAWNDDDSEMTDE